MGRTLPLLWLMLLAPSAFATEAPIRYTVPPILERDSLTALAVEVQFTGDADGETRLELPEHDG